ncbi:sigma factor-like helix-turn-helix DNA-binding protein [Streptosporangium roseum]|uniref:sigma-70 region 4 domain-containing protein n=1 Tax=Streptosporangium roseum TaxID=2001 RepID=UPI0033215CB0
MWTWERHPTWDHDRPPAEVADALGISVGTVRSRLSRARKKLEKSAAEREPSRPPRQVRGDRDIAARFTREEYR